VLAEFVLVQPVFPALLLVDQRFDFVREVEAVFGDLGVQLHGVDGDGEFLAGDALADFVRHQDIAFPAVVAEEGIHLHFAHGAAVCDAFASSWSRYDLIAIDEVGYVPLAEVGAEFLFQVIAERPKERR